MLKICVIGCGQHASVAHGPSIRRYAAEYPDTFLAACCDLNGERTAAYAREFGFAAHYTDMDEMLAREQPDAVCVAVPEPLVCNTAIHVMKKGFAVLLEKPPGLTAADNLRLIEAARETGVIHQVAFNRRYLPLITELKRQMAEHTPGGIQSLFYEFYRSRRAEPTFETTAIHAVDTARHIVGSPYREVRVTYRPLPDYGDRVVDMLLECLFENGVVARINVCPCTGVTLERFCVHANDVTFFLTTPIWDGFDAPGELLRLRLGQMEQRVAGPELCPDQAMYMTNGFYDEDRAFFECVRAGKHSADDLESTYQSVAIAEALGNRAEVWRA